MQPGSAVPSGIPASPWSRRERLAIAGLLALLALLLAARVATRRLDSSRLPRRPDILVLHVAGLRSDIAPLPALAGDLGLAASEVLAFRNAFAQSDQPLRSALSALRGSISLDLAEPLNGHSLPARLRDRGWRTTLLDDEGSVLTVAGPSFERGARIGSADELPAAVAAAWGGAADRRPVFVFAHVAGTGTPLHADTTEAEVLRERYAERAPAIRGTVARAAQTAAAAARGGAGSGSRPLLLVLLGASGQELGEHPQAPERPYDPHLRVPFIIGLLGPRDALPRGVHADLVQSADLAPTLLDFVDARPRAERRADASGPRSGRSLEPLAHGWHRDAPHESLLLVSGRHVALRTADWKLIAPVARPWEPQIEFAELYALAEDPAERSDLAADGSLGPVGRDLMGELSRRLPAPARLAAGAPR